MKILFAPIATVFHLLRNKVSPRKGEVLTQKPAAVQVDREAFERRTLQLYFDNFKSTEAQEHFRVLEEPPRPRGFLRRVR